MRDFFPEKFKDINIISCHPGWSVTPGVRDSISDFVKYSGGEKTWRTHEQAVLGIATNLLCKGS